MRGRLFTFLGPTGYYLGQSRPDGQIVFGFAMGFAAETPNAAFGILVNVVLAHLFSSWGICYWL